MSVCRLSVEGRPTTDCSTDDDDAIELLGGFIVLLFVRGLGGGGRRN